MCVGSSDHGSWGGGVAGEDMCPALVITLDTSHSQSRVHGTGQTDGRGSGEEQTPAATSGQMRVSAEDLGMFPGSQVQCSGGVPTTQPNISFYVLC